MSEFYVGVLMGAGLLVCIWAIYAASNEDKAAKLLQKVANLEHDKFCCERTLASAQERHKAALKRETDLMRDMVALGDTAEAHKEASSAARKEFDAFKALVDAICPATFILAQALHDFEKQSRKEPKQ